MRTKFAQKQLYFVGKLDSRNYRPGPDAIFEVQILNSRGEGHMAAYLGKQSEEILYLVAFATQGPQIVPTTESHIPLKVLQIARTRATGDGVYVDDQGGIVEIP